MGSVYFLGVGGWVLASPTKRETLLRGFLILRVSPKKTETRLRGLLMLRVSMTKEVETFLRGVLMLRVSPAGQGNVDGPLTRASLG